MYTEGVSNPDAVYFIRDGEFEVTKTIKSSDAVDQDDQNDPVVKRISKSPIKS